MRSKWFRKAGWIFIPTAVPGMIVAAVFLLFCVHIFVFIDNRSHSVSDTLYGIFPFVVPAFLLYLWIGSETSGKD